MGVRDFSDFLQVDDVAARVADRFAEHALGAVVDQCRHRVQVFRIDKSGFDTHLWKGVRKQVVSATVQRRHADDVIAGLGNSLDRIGGCSLARGEPECRDATLHVGNALLQHVCGWVHYARIDIAEHR